MPDPMTPAAAVAALREFAYRDDGTPETPLPSDKIIWLRNHARELADLIAGLVRERDTLAKRLADEERAHIETIRHRDFCEEWADKLASGVGGIDLIGEHSNLNNPWERAYDIMRTHDDYEAVRKERDDLAARVRELEADAEDLRQSRSMNNPPQDEGDNGH